MEPNQSNNSTRPSTNPNGNLPPRQNPPLRQAPLSNPGIPTIQGKTVLRPMMQELNQQPKPKVNQKPANKTTISLIVVSLLITILGIGSGYFLALNKAGLTGGKIGFPQTTLQREVSQGEIKAGVKVGIADERTFKDSAEGILEKGGIEGEGSHHIKRPGGDSQTIYITSSVIDLDQFNGRKVKVWGETFSGQKAGWFMDVGKLEVTE